ncbi:amidohydrolase [Bradyrhizobium sp. BRP22]|uniref:amidohydrolase family protein n=1 Tax=Bradyrhizobium sp. BRP22 TaxID=2793821 RepID=UPI001CD71F4A|nr:amidohydrolase family protein [Bradyrhizobium sp. BRP22]MCA1454272.1 amidohydrolase [Bradyrhizobium sp. BRP22]
MFDNTRVIAIEEHYWDPEMAGAFPAGENKSPISDLLTEIGDIRLRAMDEAGIDVQVLSHGAPAAQKLSPDIAVDLTQRVNDRLAEACARHPDRFAAFAALPTPVPDQAARELERCIKDLKFKGAMIHGLTNGLFIDDKRFWPIFEVAEKLDVPIYLHPSVPHAEVTRHYYDDYARDFPTVIRPAWGFTVETATAAIRLILSRALERYPRLQIILGHLGETLPFLLWRIDQALSRPGQQSLSFRKQFCEHFHITTSGNFSTPALICSMLELGIDRIMFAVDYPYVVNQDGTDWIKQLQLSPDDKRKLVGDNAARLLKL